jgi:aminoglycoside phosphotransferase (APT) family kinase protein
MESLLTPGTPAAEHQIDEALVRALLREQHPDLACRSITWLDTGWDNVMYRLGNDLLVRLPRRQVAVSLLEHEQVWLPLLADRLPIPIPVPVRVGRPSPTYPWPWSILPWLRGTAADLEPPANEQAETWTEFLRALHRPAPSNAPPNAVRGVPLSQRVQAIEERLHRLRRITTNITPSIHETWHQALAAPEAGQPRWLHGDLHTRNILVKGGAFTGVIDWGDVTSGDVATDLASIWMLFDDPSIRARCLAGYGASEELLARARGWAIVFGAFLLDTGLVDHPRHAAMGEAIFRRLEEDGPQA